MATPLVADSQSNEWKKFSIGTRITNQKDAKYTCNCVRKSRRNSNQIFGCNEETDHKPAKCEHPKQRVDLAYLIKNTRHT